MYICLQCLLLFLCYDWLESGLERKSKRAAREKLRKELSNKRTEMWNMKNQPSEWFNRSKFCNGIRLMSDGQKTFQLEDVHHDGFLVFRCQFRSECPSPNIFQVWHFWIWIESIAFNEFWLCRRRDKNESVWHVSGILIITGMVWDRWKLYVISFYLSVFTNIEGKNR